MTALATALLVGCNQESAHRPQGAGAGADAQAVQPADGNVPDGGGRGGSGEPLFPEPDEQLAISTIQDAGLPADIVGYGGMRFVETTGEGAGKLKGLAGLESINVCLKDVSDDDLTPAAELPPVNGLLVFSPHVTDEGLRRLTGLKGLKYLWIEQAQVTGAGLEHLKDLTDLESLNVRFRPLTGGIRHLTGMSRLTSLNIPGSQLTDDDLAHLASFTNLQTLNIAGSPVTDAGIAHLTQLNNLEILHLRQTAVTDAGLRELTSLDCLRELNLVFCEHITNSGIKQFQQALPNCEVRR